MKATILVMLTALTVAACGAGESEHAEARPAPVAAGAAFEVRLASRPALLEAAGVAAAVAEATLSTKLMGSVLDVAVHEGQRVRAGEVLVRIDARDIDAKAAQAEAAVAQAEAARDEAKRHAERMRALFVEEAAPRAQLDAAEAGLARGEAAVRAAQAAGVELAAMRTYATIQAPFDGVVTARFVDPGAFAAPGAPLITLQNGARLRVAVSASPDAVQSIKRGDTLAAMIEGVPARAVVEGIVPAPAARLYTVNAIVDNGDGRFLPGSAAALSLLQGERPSLVIPAAAVIREGDLTGVRVREAEGTVLRWIRLGPSTPDSVEVLTGLRDGETILVPAALAAGR